MVCGLFYSMGLLSIIWDVEWKVVFNKVCGQLNDIGAVVYVGCFMVCELL